MGIIISEFLRGQKAFKNARKKIRQYTIRADRKETIDSNSRGTNC